MHARWIATALAVTALAVAGCGDDDNGTSDDGGAAGTDAMEQSDAPVAGATQFTVQLEEQSDSGITGTATFTADGDHTRVVIELDDDDDGDEAHPAHVHAGTCVQFDPAPQYPLENVVGGRSVTTIDAQIGELDGARSIVNVHRSEELINEYIACGELS